MNTTNPDEVEVIKNLMNEMKLNYPHGMTPHSGMSVCHFMAAYIAVVCMENNTTVDEIAGVLFPEIARKAPIFLRNCLEY
jgi:hypothetical protein